MNEKDRIEFIFYPAENNKLDQYVSLTFEVNKSNLNEFISMCKKFGYAIGFSYQALSDYFKA